MISKYEIRENSLTQNSVYVLLLKADEQGRKDVEKEFTDHCKLIEEKVEGFDYVFELLNITDESMLEKIRTKIDFLSSSISNVTQTFGNLSNTATVDLPTSTGSEDYKLKMTKTFNQEENSHNNIENKYLNNEKEKSSINLANTGFTFTNEKKEEVDFNDISADSSLISGDEKRIDISGNSLKLVQTMTDIKQNMPTVSDVSKQEAIKQVNKEVSALNNGEKLSNVEKENQTIVSYSPKEMKDVVMSIEQEKKGFIGNIFGKIKSVIKSNKKQQNKKDSSKENVPFSQLLNQNKEMKQELGKDFKSKEIKDNPVEEKTNPFQNLGEGIIVKKGMLDDETEINNVKKELETNPVSAQLQVDDIFAAETLCSFYDDSAKEPQKEEYPKTKKESPLDVLERTNVVKQENKTIEQQDLLKKENSETEEKVVKDKRENKETKQDIGELTLPGQIFTKKEESKQVDENPSDNQNLEPEKDNKVQTEEKNTKKDDEKSKDLQDKKVVSKKENLKEEKAIMQEESKTNPLNSESKNNFQNVHKTSFVHKTNSKPNMKIDHTLHVATPAKDAKYRNYPIEMPLIPTYTFANMDISSIRFAHAMAMSTLDDLGNSNNPFLLQGTSGTGKTHFLHAMGYEISKKIPQAKILFTNGVRFSRGIQYLLEQGQEEKLDNFFNDAEVLILDDVHLTAVNEHNREYISKILNNFLKDKKQIILSSKYPPESLKRFEELVNFKFSSGVIAELKVPSKSHFEKLSNKIVSSSFLDLTEKQVQSFFTDRLSSLGDVARDVKRVKVLSRRIESSGIKKMDYEGILKLMTGVNGEDTESAIVKKDFEEITALERNKGGSWGNFGFFFPASQIDKFRWVAFAAQESAKELGIKGGFNYALKSSYSTEHIISAAFKIANICDLKGLKGAVILGPAYVECPEPIRDNFYDILTHMLEVMMIRCGTINFEDIKKPSAYVKLLGDILR